MTETIIISTTLFEICMTLNLISSVDFANCFLYLSQHFERLVVIHSYLRHERYSSKSFNIVSVTIIDHQSRILKSTSQRWGKSLFLGYNIFSSTVYYINYEIDASYLTALFKSTGYEKILCGASIGCASP